jgi:hypothetical protein
VNQRSSLDTVWIAQWGLLVLVTKIGYLSHELSRKIFIFKFWNFERHLRKRIMRLNNLDMTLIYTAIPKKGFVAQVFGMNYGRFYVIFF